MNDSDFTPADRGESTEDKILAAAEREFVSKGYACARTTAIAEAAGVTHAMLHYYFRTKENLFEQIVRSKIGALTEIVFGPTVDESVPLFDKVSMVVERHLRFIAANPDLPRFVINEVLGQPERMKLVTDMVKAKVPKVVGSFQRAIDREAEAGRCRRIDAAQMLLDIVSLNIFPFLAMPLVGLLTEGLTADREAFVEARKRENIETIMRKLNP